MVSFLYQGPLLGEDGLYVPSKDEILTVPKPGHFYQVKKGDNPWKIAKAAYGAPRPGIFWMNDSVWNGHIRKAKKYWEAYKIAGLQFDRRYDPDNPISKFGTGRAYPVVWLPGAAGVEPGPKPAPKPAPKKPKRRRKPKPKPAPKPAPISPVCPPPKTIVKYVKVPGPERVIKVPGPVREVIKRVEVPVPGPAGKVIRVPVPGPVREVIKKIKVPGPVREIVKRVEVPGPERVIKVPGPVREIVKRVEVPGPERVIKVPGPVREVIKRVEVPVPGPAVEKKRKEWDPLIVGLVGLGIVLTASNYRKG